MRCPICLDEGDAAARLACGHALCRACFWKYTVLHGGTSCPLCRNNICERTVLSLLRRRPPTRHSAQSVQHDYSLWRCRVLVKRLKRPIRLDLVRETARELGRIADQNLHARAVIKNNLAWAQVNPNHDHLLVHLWSFLS